MEKRFSLYTICKDRMEKMKSTDTFFDALEVAAIYLRDPDCRQVYIKDVEYDDVTILKQPPQD